MVDGYVTLESVATPGNYVGIDSEGSATVPSETSDENSQFTPNVKVNTNTHTHTHTHFS